MPLSKEEYEEYWKRKVAVGKMEEKILERITDLLKIYGKVLGATLDYWYFDGAPEGEVGYFREPSGDDVWVRACWKKQPSEKNQAEFELFHDCHGNTFFVSHLFMKDSEVVESVEKDLEGYRKAIEKDRQKKAKNKTAKAKALKKLTAADKKALGL